MPFPRPLGKKDEFSTEGAWSRSKWSSFDDGYYHDALFPATVSIFHPHVDKKRLWPPFPCVGAGACTRGKQRRPARNHRFRAHRLRGPTDSTDVG